MKGLNNRVNSNGLKLKMQVMNISIHMCEYIKTRIYMDIEEKTDQNCWDNEGFVLKALLHRRVLGGVIIITTYQSNFILWKFDNRLINCFLDLSGEISGECWALAWHPASHLLIRLLRNHLFTDLIWSLSWVTMTVFAFLFLMPSWIADKVGLLLLWTSKYFFKHHVCNCNLNFDQIKKNSWQ